MRFIKLLFGVLTWIASVNIPTAITGPVVATTFVTALAVSTPSTEIQAQVRVLPFLTEALPADSYAKVYIMAGQSNMSGAGSASGLSPPYNGALNAYIYSTYGSGTNTRNASTQSWQRLEVSKNNNNEGVNGVASGSMGPELSFGKLMSDLKTDRIFIIKVAYSSSTMLGQGSLNDWKIGGPGTNYANLVTNSVLNGLQEIVTDFGLIPDIRGFIWYQGEAERTGVLGFMTPSLLQPEWTLQWSRMCQYLIDDVVAAGYSTKNMRICVGRTHNHFTDATADLLGAVRAAQVDLGTNFKTNYPGYSQYVAGSTYIPTDNIQIGVDNIHFDQTGNLALGQAYYDYFSQYVDEVVTITPPTTTGFDSDAIAYINTAGIVEQYKATAINDFVVSLKANSLWTISPAIYTSIGGNRKAHIPNLKDPTNISGYNLTFNTGITHTNLGFNGHATGTTTQGYAETHIPASALGQNTAGFYFRTPSTESEAVYGNGVLNAAATSRLYFNPKWSTSAYFSAANSAESTGASTDGTGLSVLSRTSSSNYNIYIRGTKTSISATSVAPDANTFTIGARNVNGTKGSYSVKTWSIFGFFSSSINDTNESNLRTAIGTLESTVRDIGTGNEITFSNPLIGKMWKTDSVSTGTIVVPDKYDRVSWKIVKHPEYKVDGTLKAQYIKAVGSGLKVTYAFDSTWIKYDLEITAQKTNGQTIERFYAGEFTVIPPFVSEANADEVFDMSTTGMGSKDGGWTDRSSISNYSSGTTYSAGQRAKYNGKYYRSMVGSNIGHQPDNNPTYWNRWYGYYIIVKNSHDGTGAHNPYYWRSEDPQYPVVFQYNNVVINSTIKIFSPGQCKNTIFNGSAQQNKLYGLKLEKDAAATVDLENLVFDCADGVHQAYQVLITGVDIDNLNSTIGGTGVQVTTRNTVADNYLTYRMHNLTMCNIRIQNTRNEGGYFYHFNDSPVSGRSYSPGIDNYFYRFVINNTGNEGFQISSCINCEIFDFEVTNAGTRDQSSHKSLFQFGGGNRGLYVYKNRFTGSKNISVNSTGKYGGNIEFFSNLIVNSGRNSSDGVVEQITLEENDSISNINWRWKNNTIIETGTGFTNVPLQLYITATTTQFNKFRLDGNAIFTNTTTTEEYPGGGSLGAQLVQDNQQSTNINSFGFVNTTTDFKPSSLSSALFRNRTVTAGTHRYLNYDIEGYKFISVMDGCYSGFGLFTGN